MTELNMNSLVAQNLKFYGDTSIYNQRASEAVKQIAPYWTVWNFKDFAIFFGLSRENIARENSTMDAEKFGKFREGSIFTPLIMSHRFMNTLEYLKKHYSNYAVAHEFFRKDEENPSGIAYKFNNQQVSFESKEFNKEFVEYRLIYESESSRDPNFFIQNEKIPVFEVFEDYGTKTQMAWHQENFEKVEDIESLSEFIYYLDRNVVHERGGGSFAEWMAVSWFVYKNYDITGISPVREMWAEAISSSLEEFKDKFLECFTFE